MLTLGQQLLAKKKKERERIAVPSGVPALDNSCFVRLVSGDGHVFICHKHTAAVSKVLKPLIYPHLATPADQAMTEMILQSGDAGEVVVEGCARLHPPMIVFPLPKPAISTADRTAKEVQALVKQAEEDAAKAPPPPPPCSAVHPNLLRVGNSDISALQAYQQAQMDGSLDSAASIQQQQDQIQYEQEQKQIELNTLYHQQLENFFTLTRLHHERERAKELARIKKEKEKAEKKENEAAGITTTTNNNNNNNASTKFGSASTNNNNNNASSGKEGKNNNNGEKDEDEEFPPLPPIPPYPSPPPIIPIIGIGATAIRFPYIPGKLLEIVVQYFHYKQRYEHAADKRPAFSVDPAVALELMRVATKLQC